MNQALSSGRINEYNPVSERNHQILLLIHIRLRARADDYCTLAFLHHRRTGEGRADRQ